MVSQIWLTLLRMTLIQKSYLDDMKSCFTVQTSGHQISQIQPLMNMTYYTIYLDVWQKLKCRSS